MTPLIYVINLDRDAERLASIRDNLARLGLGFERLPAVIGKEVPDWEKLVDLPTYAWRNRLDMPRAGEVGCYLSHLKAMEAFLRTDAPWCVILKMTSKSCPPARTSCVRWPRRTTGTS